VVEQPRLFLGQNHDPAGTICEPLKHLRLLTQAYATLPSARCRPGAWFPSHAHVIPSS
jgi:hypothetical protein